MIDWGVTLALALGIACMLEGLLPMLGPRLWRRLFEQALLLQEGQIRFFGIACVLLGLLIFWLALP